MASSTYDLPALPAIVRGHVTHRRRAPLRHAFRHAVYQWLVDVDRLPQLPRLLRPLARFDARDHLGGTGPHATADIRTNVGRYVAGRGIDLTGGRVVMLAQARVLGHVFNPLTVFWCFGPDRALRCVVAEVHNTYGERHAYLLEPDDNGAALTDKQFYVSPFNDVSGQYLLTFQLDRQRVRVDVSLTRDGVAMFDASFAGVSTPANPWLLGRAFLRYPLMPLRVAALIRAHGIWLWARRLPIVRRPQHRAQEGV
jgi:DUF1365 family protein